MKNNTEQANQDFIKKCLRKWYLILPIVLGSLAYAKYMLAKEQTIFNVTGSIIVQEDNSGGNQLPEEAIIQGLPFKNKGNLDRQIEILKSRRLMERVVDTLNLDILYFYEDRFKSIEMYKSSPIKVASVSDINKAYGKRLMINMLDESRFNLIVEDPITYEPIDTVIQNFGVPFKVGEVTYSLVRDTLHPEIDKTIRVQFISPRTVATWYSSRLMFQKKGLSNVLKVSMDDSTPEKMVEIIYTLVEIYNIYTQEEKNKIAAQSLDFITERLTDLSSELLGVESGQASFKSSQSVTTDVVASADRYIDKLNEAEKNLNEISATKSTLSNLESFLSNIDNQFDPIPSFGDMAGISFAPLISQYNKVVNARKIKLVNATEEHPEVKQYNLSISEMKQNILSGIRLARSEMSTREQSIVSQSAPLERKVANMPYIDKKLGEIGREKNVKEELVVYMLTKREETAIGLATEVDNTRILDDPVVSPNPIGPNSSQYYILALLLGLGIPVGSIYLLDRLNNKVRDKEELKALADIPFVGEVAFARSEKNKLITPESNSVLTEMFRLIRTNLMFLMTKGKKSVMMVTSNESGDGKTFVTTNLGIALSLLNKKTVMIELDLRKPKMTERLIGKDGASVTGMTNYLVGECEMDKIISPVEGYPFLHLISSGPTPPNPAELITSDRMVKLIEKLKEDYEYIVIDTPPIGLVADAFLLDKVVTNSIFVVRANKTKRNDIRAIDEFAKDKKLVNPSIILNGVKMPKRYGYYYGGYGKYGVYGETTKKKKNKVKN